MRSLTHPGRERLVGKPPRDDKRRRLAPADAYGHDHLWWLDRMVRTSRPLVERMTLVWHDWFATSNNGVGSQKLMIEQNQTWRIPVVTPGELGDLEARLVPGRYALWCTLAGHRARGMRATLVVRKR